MSKEFNADLPPNHPDRVAESLDTARKQLILAYRLQEGATFEQIGTWRKSVEAFEVEEEALRIHFIDRLKFQCGLRLTDETSWSKINELVGRALVILLKKDSESESEHDLLNILNGIHPDDLNLAYDRFCELMGFPAGKFEDIFACVEKGKALERQYQLKNFIVKKDSEDAKRLKGWLLGIGESSKEVAGLLEKFGEDPSQALNAVFLYYLKKTVERLDLPIGCDDLPDDAPYEEIQNLLEAVTVAIQIRGDKDSKKELLDFVALCTILTECGSEECALAVQKLHDALAMK